MTTSKKKFDIKQFIIAATLVMTVVLLVTGISYPNSALMSFANVGMFDTILRSLVAVGLVAILLSRPPRSTQVRCMIGLLSSVVLIGACVSMVELQSFISLLR